GATVVLVERYSSMVFGLRVMRALRCDLVDDLPGAERTARPRQRANVPGGIAFEHGDVGLETGCDATEPARFPEPFRRRGRQRGEDLREGHPSSDHRRILPRG